MDHPTSEEAEKKFIYATNKKHTDMSASEAWREAATAWAAYLALREEVEMLKDELEETEMDRGVMIVAQGRTDKIIEQLQADNEALRAQLDAFNPGSLIQPANYNYVTDYATGDTDAEGGQP